MKLLDRLLGRKATQLTYDQIAALLDDGMGQARNMAGVTVTYQTALQVAATLACIKVIADGCATPKLNVYREVKSEAGLARELATNIPEFRLLGRRANEWQTAADWRRMMTAHACLTGAALSVKVRGDNRRVRELLPVQPGCWSMQRLGRYEMVYRCWDEFGLIGEFEPDDVFVLRHFQWDWVKVASPVKIAANVLGLAIATERSQAAMHRNGLRPSGAYSVDGNLSEEQYNKLTAYLRKYQGSANTGQPLILDRNAKWVSSAISGVDAQHLETRRFQIEEMCRVWGVFPIMVGHADKTATFASTESFFGAHYIHTLAPWHTTWTQLIDEFLLDGQGPLFAEFDVRYLRLGSLKDRAQYYRTMVEMGIYTRNDARADEGKDPLPGLNEPLTPMNMGTAPSAAPDPEGAPQ